MRLFKGSKDTSDEDQDENEDEFHAEESGLLMAQPPPGDSEKAGTPSAPEGDTPESKPPENESADPLSLDDPGAGEGEAAQSPESGGDPLDIVNDSSSSPSEEQGASPPVVSTVSASSDSAMDLFKAAATGSKDSLSSALKDDLEDVSAEDILADARYIRNLLLGEQAAANEGPEQDS